MSAAQMILDQIQTLTTPQIEEILETLETDYATTDSAEEVRLVRSMAIEALEIRDPAHPIVRAEIARFEAEMAAWA